MMIAADSRKVATGRLMKGAEKWMALTPEARDWRSSF